MNGLSTITSCASLKPNDLELPIAAVAAAASVPEIQREYFYDFLNYGVGNNCCVS